MQTEAAEERPTCFGSELDAMARSVAGWPEGHVVFAIEVINPEARDLPPEQVQIRLTGGAPIGINRHGRLRFGRTKKERSEREAVISLAAYRAALPAKQEA